MDKKELTLQVIERLKKEYPEAKCTLDYDKAWQLLVSVRLAAQCTDARVDQITPLLYEKFPSVAALAEAETKEIEKIVRPCGELVKFIPLMFLMRFVYKYTSNRKLAIVVSTAIVLIFFGLLHYDPEVTPILSVLLIQGLGSIFELYGYIKTKNIFVPYLCHLLTDGLIFFMMLIGMA